MKEKWISSIMAGIFISLGAMTYLSIPNNLVGSLFFSTGIFLVMNLHNMLVTRVIPLMVYSGEYRYLYYWLQRIYAFRRSGDVSYRTIRGNSYVALFI